MPTVGQPCGTKPPAMLACKKHTMTRWTKNSDHGNFFCLSCPSIFLLPLTTWHFRQNTNGPFRRHAYITCRRTIFWHLLIHWKKKSLRYCWRQAGKLATREIRKILHVFFRLVYLYMFLTSLTFKNSMTPLISYKEKKRGVWKPLRGMPLWAPVYLSAFCCKYYIKIKDWVHDWYFDMNNNWHCGYIFEFTKM